MVGRHEHGRKGLVLLGRRCVGRKVPGNRRPPIARDRLERSPATLVGRLEILVVLARGDLQTPFSFT